MTTLKCALGVIANRNGILRTPQFARQFFVRYQGGVSVYHRTHLGMDLVVGHDQDKHEFYIHIEGDDGKKSADKALLQYEFVTKDSVDLYHTFVPDAFRGKGIAKVLAKEAMDHVVKENLKMKLSCTYLQKYLQDNPLPEYSERVVT